MRASNPLGKPLVFSFPSDTGLLLGLLGAAIGFTTLYFGVLGAWALTQVFDMWMDGPTTIIRGQSINYLLAVPVFLGFQLTTRLRRLRWRPLGHQFPAVQSRVAELARGYNCQPPRLFVDPHLGAQAFVGRSYYFQRRMDLVLGPDLLAMAGKDHVRTRAVFESVIRHEIGHIINGDVLMFRYATFARAWYQTWCALTLAALATALILGATQDEFRTAPLVMNVTLIGTSMGGIELLHRAFLRSREHYADLRAGQQDSIGIRALVTPRGETREGEYLSGPTWRRWALLLRRHPLVAERRRTLTDPTALLRMPAGYMTTAGVIAGFGMSVLELMLATVDPNRSSDMETYRTLFSMAAVGLPLGYFVTIGMWREAWYARLAREPVRWVILGSSLGIGLVAGGWMMPFGVRPASPPSGSHSGIQQRLDDLGGAGYPHSAVSVATLSAVALCLFLTALVQMWQHRFPADRPSRAFHVCVSPVAILAVCGFVGLGARDRLPLFVGLWILGGAVVSAMLLARQRTELVMARSLWIKVAVMVGVPGSGLLACAVQLR